MPQRCIIPFRSWAFFELKNSHAASAELAICTPCPAIFIAENRESDMQPLSDNNSQFPNFAADSGNSAFSHPSRYKQSAGAARTVFCLAKVFLRPEMLTGRNDRLSTVATRLPPSSKSCRSTIRLWAFCRAVTLTQNDSLIEWLQLKPDTPNGRKIRSTSCS